MKTTWPADGGLGLARALLLAVFVTPPIATSLSIVIEIVAYAVILLMPEPRRRLVDALRHPVVIGVLPLAAAIVVATLHGRLVGRAAVAVRLAPHAAVPLAAVLFFDAPSKRLVLKVAIVTCLVGTLVSFTTFATGVWLTERLDPGIVFHDYAVQGTTFSLAAIACVAALVRPAVSPATAARQSPRHGGHPRPAGGRRGVHPVGRTARSRSC